MERQMRKRASLWGLWYREWLLVRKKLLISWGTALLYMLMALMIQLSGRIGNLAYLVETGDLEPAFIREMSVEMNLLAVLWSFGSALAFHEAALLDTKPGWKYFCFSTPVSALRLALAQYSMVFASYLVSLATAFGFLWLSGQMFCSVSLSVYADAVFLLGALVMLMILSCMVFIQMTGSMDKAMLLTMATCLLVMAPFVYLCRGWFSGQSEEMLSVFGCMERLKGLGAWAFLATLLFLIISFICSAALYKRREK